MATTTEREDRMLHYPTLLTSTGDAGYTIFRARPSREEALEALRGAEIRAVRRDYDEEMRARGFHEAEAAEVVLTSLDLYRMSTERYGDDGHLREDLDMDLAEGEAPEAREVHALVAELGLELPALGIANRVELMLLGAAGRGDLAAWRIRELAVGSTEARPALLTLVLEADEFCHNGERELSGRG